MVRTFRCYNTNTLVADSENQLTDVETNETAVLPEGALVQDVWLHKNISLTSDVTLEVGVQGNVGYMIPQSGNVTTTRVNNNDVQYYIAGAKDACPGNLPIVVSPVAVSVSGQLQVYVRYILYSDLP